MNVFLSNRFVNKNITLQKNPMIYPNRMKENFRIRVYKF